MTTVNCTYLDQSVKELLERLNDPANNSLSDDRAMYQLGRKLGENILSLINSKFIGNGYKKVYIATTVEDADYLAKGILEVIDAKISNLGFACFWNHRFAPSGIKELMVAPIVEEYMEPICDHIDYLIVATSVVSDDCVLRTNLTHLVEKINPLHIIIASPVITKGAKESVNSQFEVEISNKFEFLYFAEDSEDGEHGNSVSGIIAKFEQSLESIDQDEKNKFTPQIVKMRRDGYVIAHKTFRQADAHKVIRKKIYANLKEKGLSRGYVDTVVMPSWWRSLTSITPSDFINLAHSLSKRLSLDFQNILKLDMPHEFPSFPDPAFKKNKNTTIEKLRLASYLNWRLIEIVGGSISEPYIPMPNTSFQIREEILSKYSSINLQSLIKYCWEHYLPVVHFNKFPKNTCKPDGFASNFSDRPVIVIGSDLQAPSKLLFIVAHELGHIVLGHVKDKMLIDENLRKQERDDDEDQADRFAIELLFGRTDPYKWDEKLDYTQLKRISQDFSRQDRVAQGAILLNYAYHKNDWKKVNGFLKTVKPELINAPAVINDFLKLNLHSERLSDDAFDYLHRIEVLAA
jgi:Zn-dependent peptidase ImmA (M78 family)